MTTPEDPSSTPQPGQPSGPPQYGAPPPGPPQYGAPQYGAPQYGAPPPGQWGPPGYGQQQSGTNGLAIGALVCAFLCWPVGIVLGFVARSQIKRTGQSGDGMALAAIIIGFVVLAIVVIAVIAGASSGSGSTY
ncbi:MAG: hypothetical protein JWP11_3298 [Frankiales bacterium]|nr:hypothetical protein [Frankiales bacterium]